MNSNPSLPGPTPFWQKTLSLSSLAIASVFVVAAYSSFTRPIWIDEFLHFALGSHRSTAETWLTLKETLPTFNFGQTGVYMMVDYWLLHHFGANSFLLRLPSLLSAVLLLLSSLVIAARLGFGYVWTLLLLGCFFCQKNLMYYAGEARPYFPLAGAAMGVLAFYLFPRAQRSIPIRLLGLVAIWWGVLFHPYFALYWLVLAVFAFAFHAPRLNLRDRVIEFIRHCDLLISLPAAVACLVLAKLTWLRGTPVFNMDPFQWIRGDGLFKTFFVITHFQFLGKAYGMALAVLALGLPAGLFPAVRRSPLYHQLLFPLGLLVLALGMSLVLSAISYTRGYWVLPRQWVASEALCCLAMIWFAKEAGAWAKSRWRFSEYVLWGLTAWLLFPLARPIYGEKWADVRAILSASFRSSKSSPVIPPGAVQKTPANNDEWVALANENIKAGGPVWPVFRQFYGRKD